MDYQDMLSELYEYTKTFKEKFAVLEDLNPNYIEIHISDNGDVVVIPTFETGLVETYRY